MPRTGPVPQGAYRAVPSPLHRRALLGIDVGCTQPHTEVPRIRQFCLSRPRAVPDTQTFNVVSAPCSKLKHVVFEKDQLS